MKDWLIRLKGKHMITIKSNGAVVYSLGKTKLFILNNQALVELKDMIQSSLSVIDDGIAGNDVRYNDGKKPIYGNLFMIKITLIVQKIIIERLLMR